MITIKIITLYSSIEKRLISEVEAVMNIKKTENSISSECNHIPFSKC